MGHNINYCVYKAQVPYDQADRIPGFHLGGPGSVQEQFYVFQSTFIMLQYTLVLPKHSWNKTSTLL